MSQYKDIVIETYEGPRESSTGAPPARPLPGQGLKTSLKVECSGKMRKDFPIGTKFIVTAKITDREGTPFVYSHYKWSWKIVTSAEALKHINSNKLAN